MTLAVPNPEALLDLTGASLGPTDAVTVTARDIANFRSSTSADRQPSGGTPPEEALGDEAIPPLMSLSLVNRFLPDLLLVEEFSMGVNVGLDAVVFGNTARSGATMRATGVVQSSARVGEGVQVVVRVKLTDQAGTAVCTADTVSRFFA